eukprot:scaffold135603_cov169-Phaeocystis_antarctica.AAC.1
MRDHAHGRPADDAPAGHVRVLPQGAIGPPAPRGPRVEPRAGRVGLEHAPTVAQGVSGCVAH